MIFPMSTGMVSGDVLHAQHDGGGRIPVRVFPTERDVRANQNIQNQGRSKSNFWPFLGSSRFSGILTLTLFCHTKSVEKKEREGNERGERGRRRREEGERRGRRERGRRRVWAVWLECRRRRGDCERSARAEGLHLHYERSTSNNAALF